MLGMGGGPRDRDGRGDSPEVSAARSLLDAIRSRDPEAVASAFAEMLDACERSDSSDEDDSGSW